MARSLSHILTRTMMTSSSFSLSSSVTTNSPALHRLLSFRGRSSLPVKSSSRVEFELEDPEVERVAIQRLEDAIHRVIAKRVQPDWLPFLPGASFWVPPTSREKGFVEVIGKLASSSISMNEDMALTTNRGWPSSDYFFKGVSPSTKEAEPSSKHTTQSEDDEG